MKHLYLPICLALALILGGCAQKEPAQTSQPVTSDSVAVTVESSATTEASTDATKADGVLEDSASFERTYKYEINVYRFGGENGSREWDIGVETANGAYSFIIGNDEIFDAPFSATEMITEADVNFDGTTDILVFLGHAGAHGHGFYKCYLVDKDGKCGECESFAEIPNPTVDSEKQRIMSSWSDSAAVSGQSIYKYIDGQFTMTEKLTLDFSEDTEKYTDEILKDGVWQTREYNPDNWN